MTPSLFSFKSSSVVQSIYGRRFAYTTGALVCVVQYWWCHVVVGQPDDWFQHNHVKHLPAFVSLREIFIGAWMVFLLM